MKSWVESANDPRSDFPIENLPYGVYRRDGKGVPSIGVAIGDRILDVARASALGLLPRDIAQACGVAALNDLMALGRAQWSALRKRLTELLEFGSDKYESLLVPMSDAEMLLPAVIGNYTDFYASIYHASNVGAILRPDNPLLPNYKYVPIGYHGRASSIVVSGAGVRRPWGQMKDPASEKPSFGPSRSLDYELEVGFFVGPGNTLGDPIAIAGTESHIFGLCLVNDWSARDIQAWEYQPLGPFLAKSFATTISPWVVTTEALEPFRVPAFARPEGDPAPLPYLNSPEQRDRGGIDITLEVRLRTAHGGEPALLSRGNFRDLYWTIAQLLTHHTSNGCNLIPGDLLASGTVSGKTPESRGSLVELTRRGAEPIQLPNGQIRRFLEDGDEVVFRAYCEREGARRIGFGECRGKIMPAHPAPSLTES